MDGKVDGGLEFGALPTVDAGGVAVDCGVETTLLAFGSSCPATSAAANLFVNDEIAHPVQPESMDGVVTRGTFAVPSDAEDGRGMMVSGNVWLNLRMRLRYRSWAL